MATGMKIVTHYDPPPIPMRNADWTAIEDNTYDGPGSIIGYGATEEEAIADLRDRWLEREMDRDMQQATKNAKVWDGFLDQLFGANR